MKKFLLLLCFGLSLSTVFLATKTFAGNEQGWNVLYSKEGLTFYSREKKGSSLLEFRAKGEVKISIKKALAILRTVELAPKWDENTKAKITLKNISDIEANTYSITSIPWPFQDRELLLNNILRVDKDRVALRVDSYSVNIPKYHKVRDGHTRAYLEAKMWWRAKDEKTSFVDLQVLVDPKGNIPHWVVNIVQKDMPYDFLAGLVRFSRKTSIEPNPGVLKLYNDLQELKKTLTSIPAF